MKLNPRICILNFLKNERLYCGPNPVGLASYQIFLCRISDLIYKY